MVSYCILPVLFSRGYRLSEPYYRQAQTVHNDDSLCTGSYWTAVRNYQWEIQYNQCSKCFQFAFFTQKRDMLQSEYRYFLLLQPPVPLFVFYLNQQYFGIKTIKLIKDVSIAINKKIQYLRYCILRLLLRCIVVLLRIQEPILQR